MESHLTPDEAARNFADILDRVRSHGESFVVESAGVPVCWIVPVPRERFTTRDLADLLDRLPKPDPAFADDLQRVLDEQPVEVPKSPWE